MMVLVSAKPTRMYKEYNKFLFTRDKIAETYCGHGHEAEVKSVEKIPIVLPQHKHTSATGEIQEEQSNGGTCTCKGNHQIGNQLNQLNLPSDRRPVTFVGIHESFARNGSFDFIINAMCITALANSFPQSAITIRVRELNTDRREDGAGEENRLENAPSLRHDGWQSRFGAIVLINNIRHEADQETRLRRFLNHFFIGAQFHAHLEDIEYHER